MTTSNHSRRLGSLVALAGTCLLSLLGGRGPVLAQDLRAQDLLAQESSVDDMMGMSQQILQGLENEPDIGTLEIQPLPPPPAPSPYQIFLDAEVRRTSNVNFVNVTSALPDTVYLANLTAVATPELSENTQLIALINFGIARFADQGQLDFTRLNGVLGLNYRFNPVTFGRLELQGQQFYSRTEDLGNYSDVAIQLQLGQTRELSDLTRLSYFYQLRANFANFSASDRLGNSFNVAVRYPFSNTLQARLGYRFLIDSYQQGNRTDISNRVNGELRYRLADSVAVRGFMSYTNNQSNQDVFSFDEFSFGLGLTAGFDLGRGE